MKISESNWQNTVIELCERLGWWVHAERAGRTKNGWRTAIQGSPGFPDIVAVRVFPGTKGIGRTVYLELKSLTGKVSQEQKVWLDLLTEAWNEVYLVYPSDYDELVEVLTLGHQPNLIERAELKSSWVNRRSK